MSKTPPMSNNPEALESYTQKEQSLLKGTITPWDSIFYRICKNKNFEDIARHHVTWEQTQEPNGSKQPHAPKKGKL